MYSSIDVKKTKKLSSQQIEQNNDWVANCIENEPILEEMRMLRLQEIDDETVRKTTL